MSEGLKVGAIVRLRSGGPAMTVVSRGHGSDGSGVNCVWFAGEETKRDTFPADALNLVNLVEEVTRVSGN